MEVNFVFERDLSRLPTYHLPFSISTAYLPLIGKTKRGGIIYSGT